MLAASFNEKLQSIIPNSSDENNILPEFDNLDNILGVSNVKSTGGEGVEAENTNLEDELAIDDDDEPMTYTFAAITLAQPLRQNYTILGCHLICHLTSTRLLIHSYLKKDSHHGGWQSFQSHWKRRYADHNAEWKVYYQNPFEGCLVCTEDGCHFGIN